MTPRQYLEMLRFEWDERKNRGNRTKHGVWAEEAQSAFRDPNARLFQDETTQEPVHGQETSRGNQLVSLASVNSFRTILWLAINEIRITCGTTIAYINR